MADPKLHVVADTETLVKDLADEIVAIADSASKNAEFFSLFLSGGSTPKALYKLLASDDYRTLIDWRYVELFFGDERCVPPDSTESNYRTAVETLISKVSIPPDNVYRMKGELDPTRAAEEYDAMLAEKFLDEGPDLLLLGMGDDGHTASLFPRTAALDEQKRRCVANHVPFDYIPPGTQWRLTLTYPFINRSKRVTLMVTGAAKADRLAEVIEGDVDVDQYPIQGVRPVDGSLTWYLDAAAAGMTQE